MVTTFEGNTTNKFSTPNTPDIAILPHTQTQQWNRLKMQLQNDDITWAMVSTGSEEKTPVLHSETPKVLDNNSQTGQNFEKEIGDIGKNEDDGNEWKVPVSVFSVLAVALGTIVSVFAVVSYKRQGQSIHMEVSTGSCSLSVVLFSLFPPIFLLIFFYVHLSDCLLLCSACLSGCLPAYLSLSLSEKKSKRGFRKNRRSARNYAAVSVPQLLEHFISKITF